jgi:hypothetical protein
MNQYRVDYRAGGVLLRHSSGKPTYRDLAGKSLDVNGGPQVDILAGKNISLRILGKTKLLAVSADGSRNDRILVGGIREERN